mmetsp:Transcript_38401/g.110341  ORF Transcript_38401/g.110341 Transcript_38401/m.110341 type:complete len:158 (-) Transcript_38401:164-637(-)
MKRREEEEDMEELERCKIHHTGGRPHDASRTELLYADHFQREQRQDHRRCFRREEEERELAELSIHTDRERDPEGAVAGQQRSILLYEEGLHRKARQELLQQGSSADPVPEKDLRKASRRSEVLYLDAVRRRVHLAARSALLDEATKALASRSGKPS